MNITKKCPSCKEVLDIDDFYKVKSRSDGHCAYCKKCLKNKQHGNKEYFKLYQRKIRAGIIRKYKTSGTFCRTGIISKNKHDYYKKYHELRKNDPHYKSRVNNESKKSRKKYPEKEHARTELTKAIRRGEIKRGNCVICGKEKAQGHHEDYSKPLEVVWLCSKHHKNIHMGTIDD